MSEINDLVIVGSGPAGYTAAIYAARAQLKPIIYEGSVTAGGALMNTTEVENFPGFADGVMGPELMESMRKQVERFDAKIITDDIVEMKLTGDIKELTDGSGNTVKAKAVILAMGSAYKEIGLKNEKRLSGRGVSWCATCDGFFFRDQVIAVVGGGDSAMEEANFLTKFASKVVLIHRRDSFRASKIMIERSSNNPKIEFLFNHEVVDVLGEDKVTGLKLKNTVTGEESSKDFTGLFVAIGHLPRNELVAKQVERFDAKIITDDIVEMKLTGDIKELTDGSGNTVKAKAVILAMGSAYKEIGLKNEKRLSGRGVSWCATCDGFFFRDQVIAVVGGGDSAMEEANFLTKFASKVVLIHRRDSFRASKIMIERASNNPKIEFLFNHEVVDVLGEDKVTGLKLKNTVTGEESSKDFTGLFVAIGHLPRSELVAKQVELNSEGYVQVEGRSTKTKIPGVFACGDLVDYTYRQAITAAGSGCQAALDAERFLSGH